MQNNTNQTWLMPETTVKPYKLKEILPQDVIQ